MFGTQLVSKKKKTPRQLNVSNRELSLPTAWGPKYDL